ncbi:MAG: DEAD/DEAH box helicase [Methanosarcinaceae archaeon]|nr:DEAD/DEAH box helicase [Methanosarcinaceae archaeon]MDD4748496.1 DEAD/DEAH box helicase [Methanosarcinaceae archaeon]
MEKLVKFESLGLSESTLKALQKKGFEEPTPIQEKVIPVFMEGELDIIGQAQTGTGKTAAFGIPIIEKISEKSKSVQAIILTPTRELAIQVSEELNSLKGDKALQIIPLYGGQSMGKQLRELKSGVDIVVGTPGRVIDHIRRKSLNLDHIAYFVLDEADEMLNMGFIEDVKEILNATCPEKRMLFFSATMPKPILGIAKKHMREYVHLAVAKEELATKLTDQLYYEVRESDKFEVLCRIIDMEDEFYGLVFCRTKNDTAQIAQKLGDRGYAADALNGDMTQQERERILRKFRMRKLNILVATDVAARGIDIMDLTHVINYSIPQDPESYVHRIGRTGRAGKQGTAITFVTHKEFRRLGYIKKCSKSSIKKSQIPKIEEVINARKRRIKTELETIMDKGDYGDFFTMSETLLAEFPQKEILAALLKYSFKDSFDKSNYAELKSNFCGDEKGMARLFVALGKAEGITPERLCDFIKEEAGEEDMKIRDIEIFPRFSFISVPLAQAKGLVEIFKNRKRGKKPFVEIARKRNGGNSRGGSGRNYRRDGKRNYRNEGHGGNEKRDFRRRSRGKNPGKQREKYGKAGY